MEQIARQTPVRGDQKNYHPEQLLENAPACFKIQRSLHIIHPQDQLINRFLKNTGSSNPQDEAILSYCTGYYKQSLALSRTTFPSLFSESKDVTFEIFQKELHNLYISKAQKDVHLKKNETSGFSHN